MRNIIRILFRYFESFYLLLLFFKIYKNKKLIQNNLINK